MKTTSKKFMKKYTYFQGILVFMVFMFGCTAKEQDNQSMLFPEIEINKFYTDLTNITDILKDYHVITLDSADDSLIGGRFNKIVKRNSFFYVCSMNEILIFDEKGKFKDKLSNIGNGPNEYEEILDFDIVSQYDEIWVSSAKEIVRYKIPTLEFCGKIKLDFYAKKFKYLGDDKFIALTPDEKVFNICSIDGNVLDSYLDKDLANSGELIVQFINLDDNIVSQLFNTNSAVCYNVEDGSFSIKDIISPNNNRVITTDINKHYYSQFGYLEFSKEVMEDYTGIIGFRKLNGQTIMSLRYPGPELAVIIDSGNNINEYIVRPSEKSLLVDNMFDGQDPSFLMTFAANDSDDSFLFVVPNDDPDLNPYILEVKEFK